MKRDKKEKNLIVENWWWQPYVRRTDRMKAEIEAALEEFAGCAVVVSHDRWFLDRIATHILALGGADKPKLFLGNWSDYEEYQLKQYGRTMGVNRKDTMRELKRN